MDTQTISTNLSIGNIGKLSKTISICLIVVFTGLVVFLQSIDLLLFAGLVLVVLPALYLMISQPKYWIYSVLLIFPFYSQDSSFGISTSDVLIGVFYLLSLFFWLIESVLISKKRLVLDLPDFLLITFFLFSFLTGIYTNESETTLINWFKEFAKHSIILFYFPIRFYFMNKEDCKKVLVFFFIMIFFCDLIQIGKYYYYMKSNIVYAYQLATSERINQILYTTAIPAGIIFMFYLKSNFMKLLFTGIIMTTIGALILTFSRTFWIMVILDIIIILFYLNNKNRLKLIIFLIFGSIAILGVTYSLFSDKFVYMTKFIEKRFSSSGDAAKDVSLKARFVEWQEVGEQIADYPLGGQGYAKTIQFKTPIDLYVNRTGNIHNGYLFLIFRFGYPLAIMYSFLFIYGLITSFYLTFKFNDDFYKPLSIGTFLAYFSMILTNYTSAQFFYRDSFFVTAFLLFSSSVCHIEYQRLKNNKTLITDVKELNG